VLHERYLHLALRSGPNCEPGLARLGDEDRVCAKATSVFWCGILPYYYNAEQQRSNVLTITPWIVDDGAEFIAAHLRRTVYFFDLVSGI